MLREEFYCCASAHKVASVDKYRDGYSVTVWEVVPRPFKFGTFNISKIATHLFDSRDMALESLGWHGVVWVKDSEADDVIDAAARLFCCETEVAPDVDPMDLWD